MSELVLFILLILRELALFFSYVLVTSFLLAKVEINIEGKHGYAEKLPVEWRTDNKWMRLFLTGTSYHLYMGLFLLAMLHSALLITGWTLRGKFLILSYLAFVTVAEDFLWFVLNTSRDEKTGERLYGLRNFKPEGIPWFSSRWLWFAPNWYFWYLPAAIILYFLSSLVV